MKTIVRKTAIAASLIIALAVSSFTTVNAGKTIYDNEVYQTTNITIRSTNENTYTIKDVFGNVIEKGAIKNKQNVSIQTQLPEGTYVLYLGDKLVKEFEVKL